MRVPPGADLPFVGRDDELQVLGRSIEARSDVSVVLVEGAAGMGKTRLLAEALVDVDASCVLRARGDEEHRLRPLGLVAKLVGPSSADDPLDHLLDRLESMAASAGRALVVVDDLQWCDDRSAGVLTSVVHRASELPATVVLAARREPRSRAVAELAATAHQAGTVLRLGRLAPDAVGELLARTPDAPSATIEAAQGHPFLLAQLATMRSSSGTLTSLVDAVPLSDVARRTLAVASVTGESMTMRELSLLGGSPLSEVMRAVGEAIDLGLLVEHDRRLAFAHDLWREAFAEEVPVAARRDLHREIATIRLDAGAEPLDVVAHLVAAAGGRDDELAHWLRDAARAAARHDLSAAIELGEQARTVARQSTATLIEADILANLAWSGEADLGAARARALLLVVDEPGVRCRVHTALAIALSTASRNAEAAVEARAALDTGRCTPRQEANLLVVEALGAWATDVQGTLDAAVRAEARARELGVPTAIASALVAQVRALDGLRRFSDMLEPARAAQAIAEQLLAVGDAPAGWALWIAGATADAELANEQLDEAYVRFGAIAQAAHRAHSLSALSDALVTQFAIDHRCGRWDDAQANLEAWDLLHTDSPAAAEGMGAMRNRRVVMEARLQLAMEDPAAAETLERWRADARSGFEAATQLVAQAEWQALRGDVDGAADSYEQAIAGAWAELPERGPGVPRAIAESVALAEIAAVAAASRRDELLRRAVVEAQRTVERNPALPMVVAAAHVARLATGPSGATVDPSAVLDAIQDVRPRVLRLRFLRALHLVFGARGGARVRGDAIVGSVERSIAALRADLDLVPGRPQGRAEPTSPWDSLSAAEQRVVELVAKGLSNGEVARELYLSRYTVESHLKRVFRKLRLRNRAELASAVAVRRSSPSAR